MHPKNPGQFNPSQSFHRGVLLFIQIRPYKHVGIYDSDNLPKPRFWYPYFVVVARLAWSNDPESYAGGSVATGRASQAGQVEGDDPD
jgi:hypothetical protein